MPRWLWWAPLGVVTLAVGLFAFRSGQVVANLSETEVINHYAALYVAEGPAGAKLTDCAALPGEEAGVWLVINCGGAAHIVQFRVDFAGQLVGATGEGPQT